MRAYYDFHIHSCLSPCGDEDMTPNNIVNMSKICGLQVIALSDHNTTGNAEAFLKVAEQADMIAFPAMELETAEEIHILCLFYELEDAQRFDREVVRPALPPIRNRVDIFGAQNLMNEMDEIVGQEERYLINATSITADALPSIIAQYNGIAIPAHVDKSTKSLLSVFGYIDPALGYRIFELSKNAPPDFVSRHPHLSDCLFLHDSDAHYLQDVAEEGRENYLEVSELSKQAVWQYLLEKS